VGTDQDTIVAEVTRLLDSDAAYQRMTRVHNPYGDGTACAGIAAAIRRYFGW